RAAASRMPVVTLTGPRQSGKTTLVRHVFPDHYYVSLERPDERSRALSDPLGFLARFRRGVILDEVQRAPELLSYIQVEVDRDDSPGRFILTGSQNLLLMESVSQTLAGRTAVLRLLPLSFSELFSREALSPERLDVPTEVGDPPSQDMWTTLRAGFYPRIHDRGLPPDSWLADYRRTYLERDLRDVLRIMDLDAFDRFMRLAAARTAQELNLTSLADDVGISQPTAKQWLTVLRVGYIVTLIPPHHTNFRKRLRKRPKLHFLDTGLCCHLLGINTAQVLENHPLRGSILESFVATEIIKSFENSGRQAPLYHWRDATGHEIDLLLDFGDHLLPIEVKSGRTVRGDSLNTLRWWVDLEGNPNTSGVLVHGGNDAYGFQGMTVRPWFLR
ncbi:MAG: ATP-binding protein, partial [Thermoanaerobaculales bacterium]|nr:ATP-binding protein [Thermoanaerobaculales bacterium]